MNKQGRKWFNYAIYFAILVFGMQMTMMGPLIEKMSQSFGLTVAQTGSFFTFSAAGFAIAIIFGGILSDRIGKKRVIIWSGFGFAASLLFFSVSPSLPLSMVLFFAAGGLGGVIESTLSAIVADINPGNERRSVTFTHVFFGVGAVIGPTFAGWLADTEYPWQAAYAVAALMAFVAAVWVTRYEYPPMKSEERLEMAAFTGILKHKGFMLLCVAIAVYVGVETSVSGWAPKYLTSELNYDQTVAGMMVSLLWAAITIGRLISSWLADKFSNQLLVGGLGLISIIGLTAQFLPALHPVAPISFFLIGLGFSGIWPLIVSQAGTMFKSKYTGTAFGLAVAAGGVGSMILPFLFGFVAEHFRMGMLLGMLSIPIIFIMGISFVLGRMEKAENAEDSAA